ncbi:MAG: transporter [Planctomycetota bacterium]
MATLDYVVIAFYFTFMLGIGWVFRRFNTDSSDYFRGGGSMQWWMTGASTFMVTFSAWTFTGAAGKIYSTGTLVLTLYLSNALANVFVFIFTSHRFRRMRAITYTEAVGSRFGSFNERTFLFIQLPLFVLVGAIGPNAVGVFMAAVFNLPLTVTMIGLGLIVLLMSTSGGAWAVVASDFVQMLVVAAITIAVAFLALRLPEVGGVSDLVDKVPSAHFNWSELARPQIIALWVLAMVVNQAVHHNDLANGGSRYLTVKNGRHARLASLVPLAGMLLFPLIWLVPPMTAAATNMNLAEQFPNLSHPDEAAYVAVSMAVLPPGLLGLFVCGIFAATMSTMDSGLNKAADIFVRSLYLPRLWPGASETHLLRVGQVFTVVLGVLMIGLAIALSRWRNVGLFDLVINVAATVSLPLAIPMLWGIFVACTPHWSAWSTALFGFVVAVLVRYVLPTEALLGLVGLEAPASKRERGDLAYGVTVMAVFTLGSAWFFATKRWASGVSPEALRLAVDFIKRTRTPLKPQEMSGGDSERMQYRVMSWLCLIYVGVVTLLTVFPQTMTQRLACLFCGLLIAAVGGLLRWGGRGKPTGYPRRCSTAVSSPAGPLDTFASIG